MPSLAPLRVEIRALVRLAVPLALAQGGQSLMGVVDTAVVGRAGPEPLAGVGTGNALYFAVTILGMGMMHGLDPLISQSLGAGDERGARRLLWQGVWLSAAISAALALPVAASPYLLEPVGIPAGIAREATRYVLWRLPSLPFLFAYFAYRSYLQAHGRGRPMLVAAALANVLNLPADVLLVFGGASLPAWAGPLRAVPAMGTAGAALATGLCTVLQTALLAAAAARIRVEGPLAGLRRPDPAAIRTAARVGLPIGLHFTAEVGIFSLASLLASRLGAAAAAAHQVTLAMATLSFTAAVGFGNAGSVRVGRAVGARDREAARRAGLAAFGCAASFMSASALVFILFPGPLARLMTDDPALVAAAEPLFRLAGLFQISDGLQGTGAGVLRGAGETRFTFAANMAGHWLVGFPVMALLVSGTALGVAGLWIGFCVGLTTVAVALVWRFLRISSREIVPIVQVE